MLLWYTLRRQRHDRLARLAQAMTVVEMARVDGSMSTFLMVHNSLTMLTIGLLGSEAQKAELLPPMARLDRVGAQLWLPLITCTACCAQCVTCRLSIGT